MKRYEYVQLKVGGIVFNGNYDHRNIIDIYAKKGYRYVGYMPTDFTAHGKMNQVDLIFEIEE